MSLYKNVVLADSPVSYWRLGESSGTEAADVQAANKGTYKGSPTLGVAGAIKGDPNTAVRLDNTDDFIEVADSASLDLADTFTYEAWLKRGASAAYDPIIDKGTNAAMLRFNSSDDRVVFRRNSVGNIVKSTTEISDSIWHHVVATKSGSTVKLYIDGVDRTGEVTNQTCTNTAVILAIGADANPPGRLFFSGSLDEVAVYNTALSRERVRVHYSAGAHAPNHKTRYHNSSLS